MKKAMAFAVLFMAMAAIAAGPVTLTAKDGKSSQHETLQAALDAARDGATIKLESDLVCDAGLKIAKAVTIDLNGKTLTGTAGDFFRVVAPKTVTLMNGTYKHTAKGKSAISPNADGAVIEVKNCVVETVYACVWSPAPALLTRISRPPISARTLSQSSPFEASAQIAWTPISAAVFSSLAALRPVIQTSAPACLRTLAIPIPYPEPPPVTSAFFPLSCIFKFPFVIDYCRFPRPFHV